MGFWEAIATCFKKYATFKGRATRAEYWWFQLFEFLFEIDIALPSIVTRCENILSFFMTLSLLVIFLPNLAVTVRRLHDINRSGWWTILLFVPFLGGIFLLILMCLPSSPANKYGDVPCRVDNNS